MATIYAIIKNQYNFKYQTVFSARFDKQDEDGQLLDDIELINILSVNRNSTQNDNPSLRIQLEHQLKFQELNDSGWRFDETLSMTKYCFKIIELKFFRKL